MWQHKGRAEGCHKPYVETKSSLLREVDTIWRFSGCTLRRDGCMDAWVDTHIHREIAPSLEAVDRILPVLMLFDWDSLKTLELNSSLTF